MADETTPNTTPATGDTATFTADPAGAAPADAMFDTTKDSAEPKKTATQTLKDEASKLGTQAADKAREYAGEGKDRATSALDEVAKMMASAADDVDAKLGAEYGRYARSAAEGISGFADSLRGKEVDDLIASTTDFVRKSPVMAVGAAAAVGFMLARLVKSSVDAAPEPAPAEPTDA
ncbi:hypothetical protein ACG3SL_06890 [Sphingomonas sp. CJ20]